LGGAYPQCTLRVDDLSVDAIPGHAAGCRVSARRDRNSRWYATIAFSDGPLTAQLLRRLPYPEMVLTISADETCAVTGDAIAALNQFPELQSLILAQASIDDEACAPLLEHPRLRDVTIGDSQLTDAGLAAFARMKSLRSLYVKSDLISGRTLDALAQLRLNDLGIESTSLDTGCLTALTRYRDLQYLSLANCRLTDESLGRLPRLPLVSSLNLSGNPISDAGLDGLYDWPQLEYVTARDTDVTDDALRRFRERR
jgi:Leucine-rich repeat (LRR) protein